MGNKEQVISISKRWKRDERIPMWHQVEELTTWRGDEAKSIAYRMEWDRQSLEDAARNEVIECMGKAGIEPEAIKDILLEERWGVLYCAGITLNRLKKLAEHQAISDYITDHLPLPPAPITFTGTGNTTTEVFEPPDEVCRVVAEHHGRGNFMVDAVPAAGGFNDLLVNRIGAYQGNTLLEGQRPYYFKVRANGDWSLRVEVVPITTRPIMMFSGTGDMVSDRFMPPKSSNMLYRFIHNGRSNFVVVFHSTERSSLVQNLIGPSQQDVDILFPAALCWWEVSSEGSWKIEPVWKE